MKKVNLPLKSLGPSLSIFFLDENSYDLFVSLEIQWKRSGSGTAELWLSAGGGARVQEWRLGNRKVLFSVTRRQKHLLRGELDWNWTLTCKFVFSPDLKILPGLLADNWADNRQEEGFCVLPPYRLVSFSHVLVFVLCRKPRNHSSLKDKPHICLLGSTSRELCNLEVRPFSSWREHEQWLSRPFPIGPQASFPVSFSSVPRHLWHLPQMCGGTVSASLRALCVLPRQPGMPCPSPLTWRLLHSRAAAERRGSGAPPLPRDPSTPAGPPGEGNGVRVWIAAPALCLAQDVCWVNDWWYRFVEMHTECSDLKLACNATREPEMAKERSLL